MVVKDKRGIGWGRVRKIQMLGGKRRAKNVSDSQINGADEEGEKKKKITY